MQQQEKQQQEYADRGGCQQSTVGVAGTFGIATHFQTSTFRQRIFFQCKIKAAQCLTETVTGQQVSGNGVKPGTVSQVTCGWLPCGFNAGNGRQRNRLSEIVVDIH